MSAKFRNLNVDPDAPVDHWGFEGLLDAVERGDILDWRRIAEEIVRVPRGKVAGELVEVMDVVEDRALPNLFSRILQKSLAETDAQERREVASELDRYLKESGLSRAEFAARMGTSQSRLSTYLTGRVVPSAALLVRARRILQRGR